MTILSTLSTTPYLFFDGGRLLITQTGQLNTTGSAMANRQNVSGNGTTNIHVTILGSVNSEQGVAIDLNATSVILGTPDIVRIGSTGTVTGENGSAAITLGGLGNNIFDNAGFVSAGTGLSVSSYIQGRIDNSGEIIGTNGAGIYLTYSNTTVNNRGVVQGVNGLEFNTAAARVFNSGEIYATSETGAALDASAGTASSGLGITLRNTGLMSGPVKGIVGSVLADVITNQGVIEGTINLGSGADKFFGRLGTIDSKISGGNDPDFIQSGRGDDVVDGGSGADTLSGNAGDDTLTGGSFGDTFVFLRRGGDDVITDFVSGTDKIDLRVFHFVNFAAVSSLLIAHPGGVELDLTSKLGGTVEFAGLTLASLTSGDFLI